MKTYIYVHINSLILKLVLFFHIFSYFDIFLKYLLDFKIWGENNVRSEITIQNRNVINKCIAKFAKAWSPLRRVFRENFTLILYLAKKIGLKQGNMTFFCIFKCFIEIYIKFSLRIGVWLLKSTTFQKWLIYAKMIHKCTWKLETCHIYFFSMC